MGSGPSQPRQKPTLYIFPLSPPCRAVQMTAKAIGLELETPVLDLMKGEQKEEKFIKINPDHTVPTLVDGSVTLWESRAIMTYLVDKYKPEGSPLYPKDLAQRAKINRILFYDISTVLPACREFILPQLLEAQAADELKAAAVGKMLEYLDDLLKGDGRYLVGSNLTLADICVAASLSLLETKDWDFAKWSRVVKWREAVKREPWYADANKGLTDFIKSLRGE